MMHSQLIKEFMIKKEYIINILSSSYFFCFTLLLLIILVLIGTLFQKEIGLKTIQNDYFKAYLISNGYFFFLGGKSILVLIFINLFFKLFFKDSKKSSTFFIHLGVLLFISTLLIMPNNTEEKYLIIEEGEQKNQIFNNDLYYIDIKYDNQFEKIKLSKNKNMKEVKVYKNCKFNLTIVKIFRNSNIVISNSFESVFFKFEQIPFFVESSYDKFSLEIEIFDFESGSIKRIFLIEDLFNDLKINFDKKNIFISLGKAIEFLPFYLFLIKFTKINYEGTNSAKSFKSELLIKDKDFEWKYDIQINKPLNYLNYKFYQMSFIENEFKNSTILYVSNCSTSYHIYIACFIFFLGLLFRIFDFLKVSRHDE